MMNDVLDRFAAATAEPIQKLTDKLRNRYGRGGYSVYYVSLPHVDLGRGDVAVDTIEVHIDEDRYRRRQNAPTSYVLEQKWLVDPVSLLVIGGGGESIIDVFNRYLAEDYYDAPLADDDVFIADALCECEVSSGSGQWQNRFRVWGWLIKREHLCDLRTAEEIERCFTVSRQAVEAGDDMTSETLRRHLKMYAGGHES